MLTVEEKAETLALCHQILLTIRGMGESLDRVQVTLRNMEENLDRANDCVRRLTAPSRAVSQFTEDLVREEVSLPSRSVVPLRSIDERRIPQRTRAHHFSPPFSRSYDHTSRHVPVIYEQRRPDGSIFPSLSG